MTMNILLIISIIGVWGNLILQAYWFMWSYKEHHRKHYLDDKNKEYK